MRNKKTIIVLFVVVAVSFSTAIWIKSRWDVWFGNPREYPYHMPDTVSRLLVSYADKGELSRTFTWANGDKLQPSVLELVNCTSDDTVKIEAEGKIFASRSGKGVYYKASAYNLSYATSYSYRILSASDTTQWYRFSINSEKSARKFIFIGDIQDTLGGISGQLFHEISLRNADVDAYILGGDVIERPMSCYWDHWFASMDSITQCIPIIAAAGNHEYLKGFPPNLEERFFYVFPHLLDNNTSGNALFSTMIGDVQIFVLDSNREFWTYPAQRSWLKQQISNSSARWKIVVLHHPIFSMRSRFNNILQRMAFNTIITNYGVDMVLQGHEHAYMRTSSLNKDGNMVTPVYITSHCSPKNYRINFVGNEQRLGGGDRYYQVITATEQALTVETFTSNHDLYDRLVITDAKAGKVVTDFSAGLSEKITVPPDMLRKHDKAERYKNDIDRYLKSKSR